MTKRLVKMKNVSFIYLQIIYVISVMQIYGWRFNWNKNELLCILSFSILNQVLLFRNIRFTLVYTLLKSRQFHLFWGSWKATEFDFSYIIKWSCIYVLWPKKAQILGCKNWKPLRIINFKGPKFSTKSSENFPIWLELNMWDHQAKQLWICDPHILSFYNW